MDFVSLATGAGGTGVVAVIVGVLWTARERKRDEAEAKVEQMNAEALRRIESAVEATRESQRRTETELHTVRTIAQSAVALSESFDKRLNGMSADYGARIKELELKQAAQEAVSKRKR